MVLCSDRSFARFASTKRNADCWLGERTRFLLSKTSWCGNDLSRAGMRIATAHSKDHGYSLCYWGKSELLTKSVPSVSSNELWMFSAMTISRCFQGRIWDSRSKRSAARRRTRLLKHQGVCSCLCALIVLFHFSPCPSSDHIELFPTALVFACRCARARVFEGETRWDRDLSIFSRMASRNRTTRTKMRISIMEMDYL